MTRRSWNWRAALTDEERAEVAAYDAAMAKVKAAQLVADKHRLAFQRIQNRALQRAKYHAMKAAMDSPGCAAPLGKRSAP